jgi:hypothetical protein
MSRAPEAVRSPHRDPGVGLGVPVMSVERTCYADEIITA